MPSLNVTIRSAAKTDLEAINRVIESAIMSWRLPERVKRLSLPSYRYDAQDYEHLDMVVAETEEHQIIGVAAWQPADDRDTPGNQRALLLHGIYIEPSFQHRGIGQQLFHCAENAVRRHGYQGLLVKAQQDANDFFIAQDMNRLESEDPARQYANRFWKKLE